MFNDFNIIKNNGYKISINGYKNFTNSRMLIEITKMRLVILFQNY